MTREKNRQKPFPSSVAYFERVIGNHNAVFSLTEISENVYEIQRINRPSLRVLVADIYIVSEADIFEIATSYSGLDCVLLIGFYNRTSWAAKERARAENMGLFDMREFFGALNFTGDKFLNYELKKKDN